MLAIPRTSYCLASLQLLYIPWTTSAHPTILYPITIFHAQSPPRNHIPKTYFTVCLPIYLTSITPNTCLDRALTNGLIYNLYLLNLLTSIIPR